MNYTSRRLMPKRFLDLIEELTKAEAEEIWNWLETDPNALNELMDRVAEMENV